MSGLRRAAGLDGLRGLAAITVALGHFFFLFPQNRWTAVWKYSPLYALIAGREAVVVFFVLSGFALHKMMNAERGFEYWRFALRRIVRIYGPYLGALGLAVAGNVWLSEGPRAGFSRWFNDAWPLPVHAADVRAHVLFLGDYDTGRFNGAFWSLVHEMRISLVFPLLNRLVRGRRWWWGGGLTAAMMVSGSLMSVRIGEPNNLGETLHYAGLFVVGILIAERPSLRVKPLWMVAALVLFYYGRGVARVLPVEYANLLDVPVGLGAAAMVIWALDAKWLLARPVQWLGERSYSLYLVHVAVLLGFVNLLHMKAPSMWLVLLYVPAMLGVTELFFQAAERPLLQLSRRLS